MSGRHQIPADLGTRRRGRPILFGVAGLSAALVAGLVALGGTGRDNTPRAAAKKVTCTSTVTVSVAAAAAIAPAVSQVATSWMSSNPVVSGSCVVVSVRSGTPAAQEAALAASGATGLSMWIPDSSLWPQRLHADLAGTAADVAPMQVKPAIASSPLVIVTTPTRAAQMARNPISMAWKSVLAGRTPVTLADPTTSTDGLLSLVAVRSLLGRDAAVSAPDEQLVSVLVQISHSTLRDTTQGFSLLAARGELAPVFMASEQAVWAANRAAGRTYAAGVYPREGTLQLDYPVVRFSSPTASAAAGAATAAFEAQLRTAAARRVLAGAGLRSADGSLDGGGATTNAVFGDRPTSVTALSRASADQAVDLLRLWGAATAEGRMLAVIDVSGSMNEPAGNGLSKIQIAAAAASAAVSFYPDSADVGLWSFSSDQGAATPWAQLVPIGPMSGQVGVISRRQALLTGSASMIGRVHGGTALYDTALAAFGQVQAGYDPRRINSVVLLTDGQNDYAGGLTLPQLLSALRTRLDPARPTPIITIGIGNADESALRQISAVTGGKSYLVKNPDDIKGVFLDAVLQRRCRPHC